MHRYNLVYTAEHGIVYNKNTEPAESIKKERAIHGVD
jgi:hypothetical protein